MHRIGIVLALATALACGSKDSNKGTPDPGAVLAEMMGMPSGAISSDGKEAVALTESKTDWTTIATSKDDAPAEAPKVDPKAISTSGIADEPMAGFAQVKATGFRVAYAPTQKFDHFRQAFMKEQLFENVAAMLNQTIKMPRVVDIHLVDCGTVNAFYDPNNNRIIMCYELMDYYTKMFQPVSKTNEELGNSIVGATFFAFFHELGHGLIHQLDLPAVGREEDAVDQMATLILMEGGDEGVAWAMAGARWFSLQSEANEKAGNKMPFWDEHSLEGQRFYNIACMVFGSDPDKYGPMVKNGYLPEPRARRCPSEYGKIAKAWERLLGPHFKKHEGAAETTTAPIATAPPTTGEAPAEPAGDDPMAPKPLPGGDDGQPAAGGLSCETVVDHALTVVVKELMEQAQAQGPEMVQQVQEQLQSNGPLIRQAGIQECETKNWTAAQRACVMKGTSMKTIDACDID